MFSFLVVKDRLKEPAPNVNKENPPKTIKTIGAASPPVKIKPKIDPPITRELPIVPPIQIFLSKLNSLLMSELYIKFFSKFFNINLINFFN